MQISAKSLPRQLAQSILHQFQLVIKELKTDQECEVFLRDFLTDTERVVLAKRLAIAGLLKQGKSYEYIKDQLNVSSATISTVADNLKTPGIQTALEKIQEEEWAENLLTKLPKMFRK
jgi:uncharacterized protein YerC